MTKQNYIFLNIILIWAMVIGLGLIYKRDYLDQYSTQNNNLLNQNPVLTFSSSSSSISIPKYPLLITSDYVYDQNQNKILSFDKVQNSKNKFVFLGGFGNLKPLESIKKYNLIKFGNDYLSHDGNSLVIAPNGNFENSFKTELKKNIVEIRSFGDRFFITTFNKERCSIDINSNIDLKTCEFDLYSADSISNINLKLISSNKGFLGHYGFSNFIPTYADNSGYWIVSGFGDSCASSFDYLKYDYSGSYIEGFNKSALCGTLSFSRINNQFEKIETLYSSECPSRGIDTTECKPKYDKLKEVESQNIPKEMTYPFEVVNFQCGEYKFENDQYYFNNQKLNDSLPKGSYLGCKEK